MAARAQVIIAAYNQMWALPRVLRGYLRQTFRDFTLTVADDGSRPDTGEYVRAFAAEAAKQGLRVSHVWHEDKGFRKAAICNEAVRQSEGEPLLIFTDADAVPPATYVEKHVAAHRPRSFHAGWTVNLSQEVAEGLTEADIDAGRHEHLMTPEHRRDLRRRAWKSRIGLFFRRKNRPKVIGSNMAIDRALFEELNGFDERFDQYGFEDSDLRDRAMRAKPRPPVAVMHGTNDVIHLWHPRPSGRKKGMLEYYQQKRPVRCEMGLVRPGQGGPG